MATERSSVKLIQILKGYVNFWTMKVHGVSDTFLLIVTNRVPDDKQHKFFENNEKILKNF